MTTNFEQALADHGSAKEAVRRIIEDIPTYEEATQWVLDNAAAIHAHQRGQQTDPESRLKGITISGRELWEAVNALTARTQALEDAPGPRPNDAEVSALRQRMDALTETLEKMRSLDTSDVLTALVRDVQHIKKWAQLLDGPKLLTVVNALHKDVWQLKTGQSADPQPVATPEPEPVYKWVGNDYCVGDAAVGQVGIIYTDQWIGLCDNYPYQSERLATKAEARAWVEAQFNTPKP